jgi:response regulator RpfG family c-di-GMP phosphodiesterase
MDGADWRPDGVEVSLAALLELVEEAAPKLAAHMERTARLARQFALELGLSKTVHDVVVRAARVHDVGKLVVPDTTDAHAPAGQQIIERKPALLTLGPVVRATHERWNGRGYPDGLSGSAIPLPARVVAVCDAFDTLTRPYSRLAPLSVDDALGHVRRESGTRFDPALTDPFCDLVESRRECPAS